MITSITIYNAGVTSNIVINNATYPVEDFTWDYDIDTGEKVPKMRAAGRWPNKSFGREMMINCEGHILADTTTAYWTARKALLSMVVPQKVQTEDWHNVIRIVLDGDANTYTANVSLEDFSAPIQAFYPTVTPFQFQWSCADGYWTILSSLTEAYI